MTFPVNSLLTICLCLLIAACGQKKEIPSGDVPMPADSLVSSEKMIHIMADIHVVEAVLLLERNQGNVSETDADFYYQGIFRKNHISKRRFDENLKYYRQNPVEFAKMYDRVIRELENRQKYLSPAK